MFYSNPPSTASKHQELNFLMISGGAEVEHMLEMG